MFSKTRGFLLALIVSVPALVVLTPPQAAAAAKPSVTRVSVTSGPTAGGTRVRITGKHLTRVTAVRFGAKRGTKVVVRSATSILVTAPAHAAGVVHVRVVTRHGTSRSVRADRFRYVAPPVVTRLSVSSGPSSGGTRVTITGRNLVGVRSVRFGDGPATAVAAGSATRLTVTAPAHAAGSVHVRVVTRYGRSKPVPADRFAYLPEDWTATTMPRPADAAGVPRVRDVACWGAGRCAAIGAYTDTSGDGAAVLWTLNGTTWIAVRAPLPADAAADPVPLSDDISCGAAGLCAAHATYYAHRNGSDRVVHNLVWTLASGGWSTGLLPLPATALPATGANVESLVCAGTTCAAMGNYSSTTQSTAVFWDLVGGTWTLTEAPLPGDAAADPFDDIASLACEGSGTCVASGYYLSTTGTKPALWRSAGAGWVASSPALPAGAGSALSSTGYYAACGAPGACVATVGTTAGNHSVPFALTGGAWAETPLPLPADAAGGSGYLLSSVACAASGVCVAAGRYADAGGDTQAVLWTRAGAGAWTAVRAVPPANAAQNPQTQVRGLSCSGAGTCVAVGAYTYHANGQDMDEHGAVLRVVWQYAAGAWTLVAPFADTQQDQMIFSLSCGADICGAHGTQSIGQSNVSRAWTLTSGGWHAFAPSPPPGGTGAVGLDGIVCGGVGGCVAVGVYATAGGTTAPGVWVLRPPG
jgi:IPT/TIG domain-containing protein